MRWQTFCQCCEGQNVDPVSYWVKTFLCFLQSLFGKGVAADTVIVYTTAISACHEGVARTTLFSHLLVKRFLSGTYRLRPPQRASAPWWDLSMVLEALWKHRQDRV